MIVGSNILAGASGQQGYFLNRSVRMRGSVSAYFSRTLASTTNRKTFTQSMWIKRGALGTDQYPIFAFNGGNTLSYYWNFDTLNRLSIASNIEGVSNNFNLLTTQVFRDPSAWYHIVVAMDTTQATASNRLKIYVNGVQVTVFTTATYPSLNFDNAWNNSAIANTIGRNSTTTFDGYITELNVIDGQALTPTSFGEFNITTGVWQPKKYVGTYGTNGFYLNFNDNSAATAAAIGKDSSGNGNNWTPNNISVTAGVTYDSMTDVPTLTSATTANYATLSPLQVTAASIGTLSNANLSWSCGTSATYGKVYGTMALPSTGQYYWEVTAGASANLEIGIISASDQTTYYPGYSSVGYTYYQNNGNKTNNNTSSAYGASYTTNDVIGVAFDATAGTLTFYKNNVSQGTAFTSLTGTYVPTLGNQASGASTSAAINFGQRPFSYTPPTGFKALNTYNLPTPTIANGANQFAATLWTGTGVTRNIDNSVNGKSFQPDLVWLKIRSSADSNGLFDAVRGASKRLQSNDTSAEATTTAVQSAFLSNGFTVGTDVQSNGSGSTYVGWQWKASNAAAVTNTSGSISSQVSANPTAGFSIVTYTGTGANATVGHGLGIAPSMIIVKSRSVVVDWAVYHRSIGNTAAIFLNLTNAPNTSNVFWNNTTPTSSVFSVGINVSVNQSAATYVAYAFSEIAGYSKAFSYTGNGSTDGTFVYCGFRPRWVMIKRTDTTGDWVIWDTSRNTYNAAQNGLYPNLSASEGNSYFIDILSNGFKLRMSTIMNVNAGNYIGFAVAENPFSYSLAR
jgi:hypothetical protein